MEIERMTLERLSTPPELSLPQLTPLKYVPSSRKRIDDLERRVRELEDKIKPPPQSDNEE
jgi:polyhydroxyalkanoate synthesis regulator phasin